YPSSVNTDDSGAFRISLSSEYTYFATAHSIYWTVVVQLVCRAVQGMFCDGLRPSLAVTFEVECQHLM
ncbi:unnamed protein product, partial [Choristocarpus tenellus]